MISERILNLFKAHNTSPEYRVEILDIQNGKDECNQESITFKVAQLYNNGNSIERELIIYTDLDMNENGAYIPKLKGYIGKEKEYISNESESSSHYIEVVDTLLEKSIDITFNREYVNQPVYKIFIDKKYESLYRSTSQTYIQNENKLYTGIQITFNNLKTKQSYPTISILIIGDEKNNNTEIGEEEDVNSG